VRILVLSRKRSLYSTRRLREEGAKLGHEVEVADPTRCVLHVHGTHPEVLVNGRPSRAPGAVLPRVGTAGTAYAVAVVRQYELMGVRVLNASGAIERAKNKLACLQLLATKGVPVPDTLVARYPRNLEALLARVGKAPVILKLLRGTQGTGVMLSDTPAEAESILETLWSLGEDAMIQRFVSESRARDLRALVIDGRVRGAMCRIGREGEFRSNIHRGGIGHPVKLRPEYKRAAIRAASAIGLRLAGVDLLESAEGPLVIEVNASPGFEGLEEATGLNVARLFIRAAVRR
jgi:ribosomal protein S6--L-glutamate ligase